MNTKEKFLLQVNKFKSKRFEFGMIDDVQSLMSKAKGYDVGAIMDNSDRLKGKFLSELSSIKDTADEFVDYNIELEGQTWDLQGVLVEARGILNDTIFQIESLGLDIPSEVDSLIDELERLEELYEKAYEHTQTDTDIHNEAAQISDRP
jgi:hypothetical protein|tara:strand:- start:49 stop:495 length:447 start_codon:yes stop_codon:yes gene_type:complete